MEKTPVTRFKFSFDSAGKFIKTLLNRFKFDSFCQILWLVLYLTLWKYFWKIRPRGGGHPPWLRPCVYIYTFYCILPRSGKNFDLFMYKNWSVCRKNLFLWCFIKKLHCTTDSKQISKIRKKSLYGYSQVCLVQKNWCHMNVFDKKFSDW